MIEIIGRSVNIKKLEGGKIKDWDNEKRFDKENDEVFIDDIEQTPKIKKLQKKLLDLLEKTKLSSITEGRRQLIGTKGRTNTFGCGRARFKGIGEFSGNKNRELLHAIIDYGNEILPSGFDYSLITVNKNLKAKKHKDKGNDGIGGITFLGDFKGGDLNLHYGNKKRTISSKNKLILFNGANIAHSTEPFEGTRYAFIYYSQANRCKIPGYKMIGGQIEKFY